MAFRSSLLLVDLVGVDAGAVAEGGRCWRRPFTVAVKATAGLWPTEEKLGVAGSVREELRFRSGVWLS